MLIQKRRLNTCCVTSLIVRSIYSSSAGPKMQKALLKNSASNRIPRNNGPQDELNPHTRTFADMFSKLTTLLAIVPAVLSVFLLFLATKKSDAGGKMPAYVIPIKSVTWELLVDRETIASSRVNRSGIQVGKMRTKKFRLHRLRMATSPTRLSAVPNGVKPKAAPVDPKKTARRASVYSNAIDPDGLSWPCSLLCIQDLTIVQLLALRPVSRRPMKRR